MKKCICYMLTSMLILLFLSGCKGQNDRQRLIDAYNEASTSYMQAAQTIKEQRDGMDDETYRIFVGISEKLKQYRQTISTQNHFSKEEVEEMIKWLRDCRDWSKEAEKLWKIESTEKPLK